MYYWKKKESRKGANKKCYPKPPKKIKNKCYKGYLCPAKKKTG
jgi:hypothetical protein